MARPDPRLIDALRTTADRLAGGASYRWTHMGACNCGHLAQTLTTLAPEQLHRMALEKAGDWREQVIDHCPSSGFPIDHVIDTMLEVGLSHRDIQALERLEDPTVLAAIPAEHRPLDHRRRQDVVRYMRALAGLLEARRARALAVARLAAEGSPRAAAVTTETEGARPVHTPARSC